MLGKKQSLIELKQYLIEEKKVANIAETEFCQGRTMRWGLAWSFHEDYPLPNLDYHKVS
jgi:methyltransferase